MLLGWVCSDSIQGRRSMHILYKANLYLHMNVYINQSINQIYMLAMLSYLSVIVLHHTTLHEKHAISTRF